MGSQGGILELKPIAVRQGESLGSGPAELHPDLLAFTNWESRSCLVPCCCHRPSLPYRSWLKVETKEFRITLPSFLAIPCLLPDAVLSWALQPP